MTEELGFELRMNALMRDVYDDLANQPAGALPVEIEETISEGLVLIDGCLFIQTHVENLKRAGERTGADRERWVNRIPLGEPFHRLEPAWRPQLLGWGLKTARRLLAQAAELCGDARVQTYLWLQPAEHNINATTSFTFDVVRTGKLNLYRVRGPQDDPWMRLDRHPERIPQPVLTLSHGHLCNTAAG